MSDAPHPVDPAWAGFLEHHGAVPDRATCVPHPSPFVGARTVYDSDLPALLEYRSPLRVELDRGAGQLAVSTRSIARLPLREHVVAYGVTVRDPGDPAGAAARVAAAAFAVRDPGAEHPLPEAVTVFLDVSAAPAPTPAWLAAADEAAAAELALTLPGDDPRGLEAWVDAALDRELPFTLRGGTVVDAVAALHTTARLWGDADDLAAARRWCRAWRSRDADADAAHLQRVQAGEA